jgi:hypothetical protein
LATVFRSKQRTPEPAGIMLRHFTGEWIMNKLIIAMAALAASAFFAPASHAFDCDADDIGEVAECARKIIKKVPGASRLLPSSGRVSATPQARCESDNPDRMRDCLRQRERNAPRPSRMPPSASSLCADADDAEELNDCLRAQKAGGAAGVRMPSAARAGAMPRSIEDRLPNPASLAPAASITDETGDQS